MWKFFFLSFAVERLNNLRPSDLAEELSGQFEGDMVMSTQQIEALLGGDGRGGRTGLIDERFYWTNNIVPYTIQEEDFSKTLLSLSFPFQYSLLLSLYISS